MLCRRWCWRSWCDRRAYRQTVVSAARPRALWQWCTPCSPCTVARRWTRSLDSALPRPLLSKLTRDKTAPTVASVCGSFSTDVTNRRLSVLNVILLYMQTAKTVILWDLARWLPTSWPTNKKFTSKSNKSSAVAEMAAQSCVTRFRA